MAWKTSLFRSGSNKRSKRPTISNPISVTTLDSWENEPPRSEVSSLHESASQPETSSSASVYTQPTVPYTLPASVYSMPISGKPPQAAYADIANSAPPFSPVSIKFDNGTGKLDPRVLDQMNDKHADSIDAVMASAQPVTTKKPLVIRADSHYSVHPTYENANVSRQERRYGSQDYSLAPAPLNFTSRKKSAGTGVAGIHPPVPPLPPSKSGSIPSRASMRSTDKYLAVPNASAPGLNRLRSYPSQQLLNIQHQASLHRSNSYRARHLQTRTRIPTKQGRHLHNAAARPSRVTQRLSTDEPLSEASYMASVAAGRSIWGAMRTGPRNGLIAGYGEPRIDSRSAALAVGGRKTIWEGHWLCQRTIRVPKTPNAILDGKAEQSDADFSRFVRLMTSRVGKWWVNRKAKKEGAKRARAETVLSDTASVASKVSLVAVGQPGSLNNRLSKMYFNVAVAREGSKESLAERQNWWTGRWKYTSGYWERVKGKKEAGKGKGKKEDQYEEDGKVKEVSGWYSSDDE
jgi:hypothetical protein